MKRLFRAKRPGQECLDKEGCLEKETGDATVESRYVAFPRRSRLTTRMVELTAVNLAPWLAEGTPRTRKAHLTWR